MIENLIKNLLEEAVIIAKVHPSKDARFFANHVLIMVTDLARENQRLMEALEECNRIAKNFYTAGTEECYLDCDAIEMESKTALEAK
jgi:DNA-binding Lrp family transcriptional regulator